MSPEAKVANYVELYQTMHRFLSDILFLTDVILSLLFFLRHERELFTESTALKWKKNYVLMHMEQNTDI